MATLHEFLKALSSQKNTATVNNPYVDPGPLANLQTYLKAMLAIQGKRVLLVGEAPGYKGCGITGIPFSSGRLLATTKHPLFTAIRPHLALPRLEAENTASIVWGYLQNKETTPLFWNSFPFHPHPKGAPNKNRAPSTDEIASGVPFLHALAQLFQPTVIAGIGKAGTKCAQLAFPQQDIASIRHPSFGGKQGFIAGMEKII